MFNIGDKVRVTNMSDHIKVGHDRCEAIRKIGTETTISNIYAGNALGTFIYSLDGCCDYQYSENELELIEGNELDIIEEDILFDVLLAENYALMRQLIDTQQKLINVLLEE